MGLSEALPVQGPLPPREKKGLKVRERGKDATTENDRI